MIRWQLNVGHDEDWNHLSGLSGSFTRCSMFRFKNKSSIEDFFRNAHIASYVMTLGEQRKHFKQPNIFFRPRSGSCRARNRTGSRTRVCHCRRSTNSHLQRHWADLGTCPSLRSNAWRTAACRLLRSPNAAPANAASTANAAAAAAGTASQNGGSLESDQVEEERAQVQDSGQKQSARSVDADFLPREFFAR